MASIFSCGDTTRPTAATATAAAAATGTANSSTAYARMSCGLTQGPSTRALQTGSKQTYHPKNTTIPELSQNSQSNHSQPSVKPHLDGQAHIVQEVEL
jgi:hypothetical protein